MNCIAKNFRSISVVHIKCTNFRQFQSHALLLSDDRWAFLFLQQILQHHFTVIIKQYFSLTMPIPSISKILHSPSRVISLMVGTQSQREMSDKILQVFGLCNLKSILLLILSQPYYVYN